MWRETTSTAKGGVRDECYAAPLSLYLVIVSR